jgi:UPF0716 family protein affecting phage T7 exclusion
MLSPGLLIFICVGLGLIVPAVDRWAERFFAMRRRRREQQERHDGPEGDY